MGMIEELEGKGLGVMMDGTWCGGLMCADDVLLAETAAELQKMLDVVGQYAKQRRFWFNAQKSKMIVVVKRAGQLVENRWKK